MEYSIGLYTSKDRSLWNDFVVESGNATFLFHRDFMEYHSDRFQDHSLLVWRNNKLFGILPAHVAENCLCSHSGLTYGGFITSKVHGTEDYQGAINAITDYAASQKFTSVLLKVTPSFLQMKYSSAQEYVLFHKGFKLTKRDLNFIIDLRNDLEIHKSKLKKLHKIDTSILDFVQTESLASFWEQVLVPVLNESHGVNPVHSIEEISRLRDSFPENIIQHNVLEAGKVVAGMTLFISNGVVKSQYGAATKKGKELRALDLLYLNLFDEYKAKKFRYFDMGTTTVNGSKDYNQGLTRYKEEFGALPVSLDHYKLDV